MNECALSLPLCASAGAIYFFWKIYIRNVATRLRCGEIFNDIFIARSVPMQQFWKLIYIWHVCSFGAISGCQSSSISLSLTLSSDDHCDSSRFSVRLILNVSYTGCLNDNYVMKLVLYFCSAFFRCSLQGRRSPVYQHGQHVQV